MTAPTEDPERNADFSAVTRFVDKGEALAEKAFEVDIDTFAVGREIPVDIFWGEKGSAPHLLIKRSANYSVEAYEVIAGSDIRVVKIPQNQRRAYELYRSIIEAEEGEQRKRGYAGKFTNPEQVANHLQFMERFQAINVHALVPGSTPPFDIFCKSGDAVQALQGGGAVIDEDKLGKWAEQDKNILIQNDQQAAYESYLLDVVKKSNDPVIKSAFVRENSRMLVTNLAEHPRSEKILAATKESVGDLTATIIENPDTFYGLMKINNYDYYTFTHSVNVATMTLALAMEYGVTEKDDLDDLGLGAMMHDLGKAQVPADLINKPGKLTDEEFVRVKGHVMLGYDMLRQNKNVPERAFYPLLQHHEKLSGNGYPNKLAADEIHTFGRIAAIIDIYDALTTERSYKKAFTPFEALALLSKNDKDFDKDIFGTFVKLISRQQN